MKPNLVALIAIVALLVGGGIGFALGYQPATQTAPTPPVSGPDLAAANAPGEQAAYQPAKDAPRTEAPPPDATSTMAAPSGLADWIASLGHIGPEPGTGRFYGRATTLDGKPLAGVTIHANAIAPNSMYTKGEVSVAEQIEAYARRTLFSRTGKYSAVTDADGRYELGNLGQYSYGVHALLDGYRLTCTSNEQPGRVEPDAMLDFTAHPICELVLDVRMPDGSQPVDARYTVTMGQSSTGSIWEPDRPRVEVKPGMGSIQVTAGKHEQIRSDPIQFRADPGSPLKLTVQLTATLGIAVQVERPPSQVGTERSEIYWVHLMPDPPEAPPGPKAPSMRNHKWATERSVALFSEVSPGRYRILVVDQGVTVAWQDLTVANEFLEVTIKIPEPVAEDHIVVRVTGPTGEPLLGVSITFSIAVENRRTSHGLRSIERGEGVYWVRRVAADDRTATGDWRYQLELRSPSHGNKMVEYPRDATHELQVQFEEPSSLTVTVAGLSTHEKKSRLRVQLWRVAEGRNGWSGVEPDNGSRGSAPSSDTLTYSKLSPGKYRLQLSLAGEEREIGIDRVQLAEVQFDVTAGANVVNCPVPEFYTLTVNVPDPDRTGTVYLGPANDPDNRGRSSRGESKSKLVFEGVTAGQWRIHTREGEMRVNVAADTEVTLALTKFDCLLLTEIKAGGRIEALGLRDGDRLIRVDGLEWDNIRMFETQVEGSAGRDETTWTVIRNGVQVEVSFRGKDLMKIVEESSNEGGERFKMQPALRN